MFWTDVLKRGSRKLTADREVPMNELDHNMKLGIHSHPILNVKKWGKVLADRTTIDL